MDTVAARVLSRCFAAVTESVPELKASAASRADGAILALVEGGHLAITEVEDLQLKLTELVRNQAGIGIAGDLPNLTITASARQAMGVAHQMAVGAAAERFTGDHLLRALLQGSDSASSRLAARRGWSIQDIPHPSRQDHYRGAIIADELAAIVAAACSSVGPVGVVTTLHLLRASLELGDGPLANDLRSSGVRPTDITISDLDEVDED